MTSSHPPAPPAPSAGGDPRLQALAAIAGLEAYVKEKRANDPRLEPLARGLRSMAEVARQALLHSDAKAAASLDLAAAAILLLLRSHLSAEQRATLDENAARFLRSGSDEVDALASRPKIQS